jgi:peptide/nickel transport system ATP-binding protein
MLTIKDLLIEYRQNNVAFTAVRDFSLDIATGQTYGLVGESGSGKTSVAMAIMRYLGGTGMVRTGVIELDGRDLLQLSAAEIQQMWGNAISLVPQDPFSSLNPSIRIGEQLAEALRHNLSFAKEPAAERSIDLLKMVRVPDPERIARSYPHEISGGMQQRVMIAMALSAVPELLVLDEPTTSLDVTTQAAILDLLRDLIRERQTTVLYITHNLGVVARICDRVAVLYAGELVEDASTLELFRHPLHPYTQGLLDCVPHLGQNKSGVQLQAIPGQIPSPTERHTGCIFAPRCVLALERCFVERPSLDPVPPDRRVRCHRWPEIEAGIISACMTGTSANSNRNGRVEENVLELEDVRVEYPIKRSLLNAALGRPPKSVKAVNGVDLTIERGQTLGLVGESGSGKTTLARSIVGLVERTGGRMELLGFPLPPALSQRSLDTLRTLQYVFQNPEEALNPYLTVGETLRRPFITLMGKTRAEADVAAGKLLASVRLPASYLTVRPGQLSGGEKQRVAIARAFATAPELLLADEPVSSLDVSVQAMILSLMDELQESNHSAMLFISHDLAVVGYLADKIAVMYAGQLMEFARAAELFQPPYHPYTEALLASVPLIDPTASQQPIRLEGDVPSQIDVPGGCPFHPRCPRYLGDICREQTPPWRETEQGDRIFCHIPLADLTVQQRRVFQFGEED